VLAPLDDGVFAPDASLAPNLPPRRTVELSAGSVLLRELPGPPGAPAVVLLHGWTATADLNFYTCYDALGEHFRVLAFDHRGHGSGMRTRRRFRLEDCADDVAELLDAVGAGPAIAVGYSMGGAVAQLLWRRHPESVRGLVLAATAAQFKARYNDRLSFLGLKGLARLARLTPAQARVWLSHQLYLDRKTADWAPWAVDEAALHDWRMVLEAGGAIGGFRSEPWLGEIDVPTAVIVTMQDEVVPLRRQIQLFEAIPGARALRIDAAHDAVVARPDRAVPVVVEACRAVLTPT
jgi:pimeloyl-ACP methyl ester carboxylesterase